MMQIIAGLGLTIISSVFFPIGSVRQIVLSGGMALVCMCFDRLIERAGRQGDNGRRSDHD